MSKDAQKTTAQCDIGIGGMVALPRKRSLGVIWTIAWLAIGVVIGALIGRWIGAAIGEFIADNMQ